jgi:hypothetical protein
MNWWRVIWTDSAGVGRWNVVQAQSKEHAAWKVFSNEIYDGSTTAVLITVQAVDGEGTKCQQQ